MPTLLDKSTTSPAPLPTQVLQSRHHWERWRGVLIAFLCGLVAIFSALVILHPSWHTPGDLKTIAAVWLSGLLLTAIAAAVAWRMAPHSLTDTAQSIDRDLAAKNRLEAMAALHESTTPLAKAQRDETADYLRQQPEARPVRVLPWLIGGVLAAALFHLILLAIWTLPVLFQPTAPVPPTPPKDLPHATITWKSPEAETKANPIEEVPTVAIAQSATGLKELTLEISVNGAPKKSQSLPAQPYDKAGKNSIKVSLYMDELGVEPYDIVSYYIRGQRITDQKVPDTASAIQFVQVRPFRDDIGIMNMPGSPAEEKNLALIRELKLAQLKAMKENFVLGHTDLAVNDPVRMKENDRVGKNQGDLSKKAEEVVQYFIQEGMDSRAIDYLRQAEPFMDDASKKILATKNTEALQPQGKALDLIIQLEKFVQKILNLQGSPSQTKPAPPDPFQDKQQHELKQRTKTTAGQLEQLAKKQTYLAKDMDQPPGSSSGDVPSQGKPDSQAKPDNQGSQNSQGKPIPGATNPSDQDNSPSQSGKTPDAGNFPTPTPQSVDPFALGVDKGTFAQRQARVLQGIETLLNGNKPLPDPVNQALQDAKTHATASVHQLDQGNEAGAKEPTAAAAQDLQKAVAAMTNAGEKETRVAMQQAQKDLNDAAQKVKDLAKDGHPGSQPPGLSDVAAKVQDIQKQAEGAADKQQEDGSAKGAQRLDDLANQIAGQHIAKDLTAMTHKGLDVNQAADVAQKLSALANQAAHGMGGDKPSAQEIAKLVASIETTRANLARLADKAGTQPGQAPGQQAGKDQGAGQGQQPGQTPGHQAGKDQGAGQGQQPGQTPGQQAGKDQGMGQGPGQGPQPGQGQDAGQGQGQGNQSGGSTPGDDTAEGTAPGGAGVGAAVPGGHGQVNPHAPEPQTKAFHEAVADARDEAQQAASMLNTPEAQGIQKRFADLNAKVDEHNVVKAYQAIAPPLDKLIQDLTDLANLTQRQDLIKQPDLDDAPPAYRPAVSNYFENMSKDYHPDNADKDAKKP